MTSEVFEDIYTTERSQKLFLGVRNVYTGIPQRSTDLKKNDNDALSIVN